MEKAKDFWNLTVPIYVRELFYMLVGVGVLNGIMYVSPVIATWVVGFSFAWGLLTIAGWIGDGLKLLVEPKYMDSQYGIPLYREV